MTNVVSIPDGNAFNLRVTGQVKTGDYTEAADFSVVRNMTVNFVRRGREAHSHTIDVNGRIVVPCGGDLPRGVYGVELVGYYNGEPWRFYQKDVFRIVDENERIDPGTAGESVLTYDVVFDVSFGGSGTSPGYVEAVLNAHNNDEAAHPSLQNQLDEINTTLAQMQQAIEDAGDVDDVQVDGQSVLGSDKIARIDSSGFGHVDDVIVNGQSVVEDKVASITVPTKVSELPNDADFATKSEAQAMADAEKITEVSVSVDGNVGIPSATVNYQNQQLQIAFQNLLGDGIVNIEQTTTSNDSGGTNVFTVTTVGGKTATFRVKNGEKGDTVILGDGVEYLLYNYKGKRTDGAMTQESVTRELNKRPTAEDDESLLSICDENGNIIAKINEGFEIDNEGNIKTKSFDSSQIATNEQIGELAGELEDLENKATETISVDKDEPFLICDPEGNVIAKFAAGIYVDEDGNIKTKSFDSSNISAETKVQQPRSIFPKLNVHKTEFRWLDIGNSHSLCALQYLKRIAISEGVDLTNVAFVRVSRGGSKFQSWVNGWHDQDSEDGDALTGKLYTIVKDFGGLAVKVSGHKYKNATDDSPTEVTDLELTNGSAVNCIGIDSEIFRTLLTDNQWDLITIHQRYVSNLEYDNSNGWRDHTEHGYLNEFLRIIRISQPQAAIGYLFSLLPWATAGQTLEGASSYHAQYCDTMKKFMCDSGVDFLLPCDTALENLRASSVPDTEDEGTGATMNVVSRHGFNYDGAHTASGVASYTMSCVAWEMVFAPRYGKSMWGNTYRELIADDISVQVNGNWRKYLQGSYTDKNEEKQMVDSGFVNAPLYNGCTSADGSTWNYSNAYSCVRVSDENAEACQMAAILAVNDMWTINNPDNLTI